MKYQSLKKRHIVKKAHFKYFIQYTDNDSIRSLCIKLPQVIGYAKYFDSNKKCLLR